MLNLFVSCASVLLIPLSAFSLTPLTAPEIDAELREFDTNTFSYMNTSNLKGLTFDEAIRAKEETRRELIARSIYSFVEADQPIEKFLAKEELKVTGGLILQSLQAMEDWKFRSVTLQKEAWSGSAWSTDDGRVANRYASPEFHSAGWGFISIYNYAQSAEGNALAMYKANKPRFIDTLSPAEKYDLLVGDFSDSPTGYLAKRQWQRGYETYKTYGRVPSWHGICHGWAAAAFMLPRPTKIIEVLAADGVTKVKFWPTDLKGLASLIWADGITPVRFIGTRCRTDGAKRDENGRVSQPECYDVNPGTFHMALVNQLGSAQRHLVIDSDWDMEVWNRPIVGYSYSYFNPKTRDSVETLADATVSLSDFTNDKFKKYRSPRAVAFVGIAMKIKMLGFAGNNRRKTDSAKHDNFGDTTYMYDIELDANGNIIGGEWYKNSHPDFLWFPRAAIRATSEHEHEAASTWDGVSSVPQDWRSAAKKAAAKGQPLAKIIEALMTQAKQP